MTKEEILKGCTVEGNIVKLPNILMERKLYQDVAKSLELIGGKWKGGKIAGFVFNTDPSDLLFEIANGEKRNLKKEYQFFATPSELADRLVMLSEINGNHTVLEPSAGQGAIIEAINRTHPDLSVDCYELMDINHIFLNKISTANLIGEDFLTSDKGKKYDRIIANPPFSKNQDITHLKEMYERLNDNGILVCITSTHWYKCDNKTEIHFRNWLDSLDNEAEIREIEQGAFKESGTKVGGFIVKIKK